MGNLGYAAMLGYQQGAKQLPETLSGIAEGMHSENERSVKQLLIGRATGGKVLGLKDLEEVQRMYPTVEPMAAWQTMQEINKETTSTRFKGYMGDLFTYIKIARQNGEKTDDKFFQKSLDEIGVPLEDRPVVVDLLEKGMPKFKEKGFTLAPNAAQYDAEGNLVAENPRQSTTGSTDYTLSPGGRRYDAKGNLIAENPKPPTPEKETTYAPRVRTWIDNKGGDMPVNENDPKAVQAANDLGFSQVNPTERGYGLTIGKSDAEAETSINKGASQAIQKIATFNAMDQLLDRFTSGKLAGVEKTLMQYAEAIGSPIDISKLSAMEAFSALANQMALESRNLGEGMVLAGHMSDRDVIFLKEMNPQLIISKGGNKLLLNMRKGMAETQITAAKKMRAYKKSNNGIFSDTGFRDHLEKTRNKDSIFGLPEGVKSTGQVHAETGLPVYELDGKLYIPDF